MKWINRFGLDRPTYVPDKADHDIASDWLWAIYKYREEVPESSLKKFDSITKKYLRYLKEQGFDLSKIDAPMDYLK